MPRNVKEVLKELGWGDGFHVPVANDENKKLEKRVEELIKQKAEAIVKFEVANDRLNSLKKHEQKLFAEKKNNQQLLCALRSNFDSEVILLRNAESNVNKRFQEIKNIQKDLEVHHVTSQKYKDEIEVQTAKLARLRETLAWEEEALFAWEEELAKEDKSKTLLLELKYQDMEKFNDLELRRQLLEVDLQQQRLTEHREADYLQSLEIQLGQLHKQFKETTAEQQRLLDKWHEAAKAAKNKDHLIKNCFAIVSKIRSLAREKYFDLHEKRKMLATLKDDNRKAEKDVATFEIQLSKAKQLAQSIQADIENRIKMQKTLQRYILDVQSKINLQKHKNAEMENMIKASKSKIATLVNTILKMQIKIDTINVESLTTEQQYKNTQDIYEMGQKVLKEEIREFSRLQLISFRLKEELANAKKRLIIQDGELCALKERKNDLLETIKSLEDEYTEMEERLFSKELTYELLTEEYGDLVGETLCAELDEKLREEGLEIEKDVKRLRIEHATMKFQIKMLKKELHELNLIINAGKQELNSVAETGTNLKLALNGGKKSLQEVTEELNKKILDLNVIKMQASLATDNLNKYDDELVTLERQQVILETAMQERKAEIKAQKDLMLVKRKTLMEERSALKKSIDHVNSRIGQLQKRFDITMDLLGKGEAGQEISVAYFKIKLAQEKHELQELGDELEAKINKTEKEILAMENTLRIVSCTNDQFKTNIETLDADGPEMLEFRKLEAKAYQMNDQCKLCSEDMTKVDSEINKLKAKISLLQSSGIRMQHLWKLKEKEVEDLTKDISKKQIKLARASKVLKRLLQDIKEAKEPLRYKKMALRDIELRMEKEIIKNVLQQLAEMAANYIEIGPMLENSLAVRNITLPKVLKAPSVIDDGGSISTRSQLDDRKSVISEISVCSISPSIIQLDPTILLPAKYRNP